MLPSEPATTHEEGTRESQGATQSPRETWSRGTREGRSEAFFPLNSPHIARVDYACVSGEMISFVPSLASISAASEKSRSVRPAWLCVTRRNVTRL